MNKKYIVIGSIPFQTHTGTVTYLSIKELGQFTDKEEAEKCVEENFDRCGGLINLFEIK